MLFKELLAKLANPSLQDENSPPDFNSYVENFYLKQQAQSSSMQKTLGLTSQEMESLYAEGYSLYEKNNFEEAETVFRWLVLLNPYVWKYWMGLGANQQLLKKYNQALHSYAIASLLDGKDPYAHFYTAQCYAAINEKHKAKEALKLATERIDEKERK